jgi:hypothetical protein
MIRTSTRVSKTRRFHHGLHGTDDTPNKKTKRNVKKGQHHNNMVCKATQHLELFKEIPRMNVPEQPWKHGVLRWLDQTPPSKATAYNGELVPGVVVTANATLVFCTKQGQNIGYGPKFYGVELYNDRIHLNPGPNDTYKFSWTGSANEYQKYVTLNDPTRRILLFIRLTNTQGFMCCGEIVLASQSDPLHMTFSVVAPVTDSQKAMLVDVFD